MRLRLKRITVRLNHLNIQKISDFFCMIFLPSGNVMEWLVIESVDVRILCCYLCSGSGRWSQDAD